VGSIFLPAAGLNYAGLTFIAFLSGMTRLSLSRFISASNYISWAITIFLRICLNLFCLDLRKSTSWLEIRGGVELPLV